MKTIVRYETADIASDLAGLPPVLQRVYTHRGVTSSEDIDHALTGLLPFHHLKNIDKAVQRLYQALCRQERIMIVADFDADGATSCALALKALQAFGAKQVSYVVPNRFEDGYGLTPKIVNQTASAPPDLLITVDNGIASVDGVMAANALGIDVMITDHHLPGETLPPALIIVNPNQGSDVFPSKCLAGVGVIYYVMLALRRYLCDQQWFTKNTLHQPNMAQFLDLVALGTIADVVPLDKNNRILVHHGLARIRAGLTRPGIKALLKVAKRYYGNIQASDLGFAIAPRLNAAGRLHDMSVGIACLLSEDSQIALDLAQQLNTLNLERRAIEDTMQNQALALIAKLTHEATLPLGLVLYDESWHQGVIGILAGRVKDKLHRPVVVFAHVGDDELKGSARSIEGVHLCDVLTKIDRQYPGLISQYGGHAMAAGLAIKQQNLSCFSEAFAEAVASQVSEEQLLPKVLSDGLLATDDVSIDTAELLQQAGPWGQKFPEPIFDGVFRIAHQQLVADKHLKLKLAMPRSDTLVEAMAFHVDLSIWPNPTYQAVKLAYRLAINAFQNKRQLQLIVEHLEPIE